MFITFLNVPSPGLDTEGLEEGAQIARIQPTDRRPTSTCKQEHHTQS